MTASEEGRIQQKHLLPMAEVSVEIKDLFQHNALNLC